MKPKIALVDNFDKVVGYEFVDEAHSGHGRHHRGFSTLIMNSKGQVLLQKRKHRVFDGYWDFTAASHPLKKGKRIETYQEASDRALLVEMGIGHVDVENVYELNYFAQDGKNSENEFCPILLGRWEGKHIPNPEMVYESKWMDFGKFRNDVVKNPKKYTPWARLAVDKIPNYNLFLETLSEFLAEYEPYRVDYFQKKQKLHKRHAEIQNFYRDLEEFTRGGKKLRAFLVYLGFLCAKNKKKVDIKKVLPIALAVEILHAFFLIHDDIMDRADKRRGMPTIHKKYSKVSEHYGLSMGILVGDIASFEAFKLITESDFNSEIKNGALELLLGSSLDTGFGQALDLVYANKKPTEEIIWEILDYKTAKYSVISPLQLGCVLAGGGRLLLEAIRKFGILAGRAFQLQDDILGVFGEEKIIGKSILSDICEGKNTLLITKAYELGAPGDKKILSMLWGREDATLSDLETVKKILIAVGALRVVEKLKSDLIDQAKLGVNLIAKDAHLVKIFFEMSDFIVGRSS